MPMKRFCFKIPASFSLWLKAESEEKARLLAEEWQAHAMKWEQLTEETDPGEYMDIPDECDGADFDGSSFAYIEAGEIELLPRCTEEIEDGEDEEAS